MSDEEKGTPLQGKTTTLCQESFDIEHRIVLGGYVEIVDTEYLDLVCFDISKIAMCRKFDSLEIVERASVSYASRYPCTSSTETI